MFLSLALVLLISPIQAGVFIPAQRYIALEGQKTMLFEYGRPFKLHKRNRGEMYNAAVGS
uniref:hypothetical protein n=1 Tax=Limnohabitans sp. TaxID=1907725 RepID=UPI004048088F